MVRHIEFTINFDLTCWGEKEDFEIDTKDRLTEEIENYITNNPTNLLEHLTISKIWYEEV